MKEYTAVGTCDNLPETIAAVKVQCSSCLRDKTFYDNYTETYSIENLPDGQVKITVVATPKT